MYKRIFFALLGLFLLSCKDSSKTSPAVEIEENIQTLAAQPSEVAYGFVLDSFLVQYDTIQPNWTLSHLLAPHGVSQWIINLAANQAADSLIGLKYIKAGTPVLMLMSQDTLENLQYCIYPKNKVDYIVFNFTDSVNVQKFTKPNTVKEQLITGEIIEHSNLTLALNAQLGSINMTGELAERISGLLAWTIDFFKLHAGDELRD